MTDLNVVLSDAETGDELIKFSVHRGKSYSMNEMIRALRDTVEIAFDTFHYVNIAQEEEQKWETVGEFLSRITVPGGWLYRYSGDPRTVFVPDPEWKPYQLDRTKDNNDGAYPIDYENTIKGTMDDPET